MGLNVTPLGERIHIGFFGMRNVGKSSLVNAITNQEISVVSQMKGTTTDPVKKTMEILPLGPVVIIDTPGFDDKGILGEKRVERTKTILRNCDIAVLVTVAGTDLKKPEKELIRIFNERNIPYIIVKNQSDKLKQANFSDEKNVVYTSTLDKTGIEELKEIIANSLGNKQDKNYLMKDLIHTNEIVVLVTPIDKSAPKGRIILPQQMAIREILDAGAIAVATKETELKQTLSLLSKEPALVITDSQVFKLVNEIVPPNIPLTSFSILMARYKGFLKEATKGARRIDTLQDNSKVLISEGCTHHRQCEDIGTVKLPKLLEKYTGKKLELEWSSGNSFPENLGKFDLIIHCGGCMLNAKEMQYRMNSAKKQEVPFTNYGIAIAYMNGILERTISPILKVEEKTKKQKRTF